MAKDDTTPLEKFLEPFSGQIRENAFWLRNFVWDLYPKCNELIYDNYNALAFGWSPTDRQGHLFCSVAAYRGGKNVHFGFYWGSQLKDPKNILLGNGNQYRYVLVTDIKSFPKTYIKALLKEAYANSFLKIKDQRQIIHGQTIVKSVSPKKRVSK